MEIVWRNVILMGSLHLVSIYGFYLIFFSVQWKTVLAAYILYTLSGIGITAGSHRLWSHRSYKAKLPYRIMMMILQTMAFQVSKKHVLQSFVVEKGILVEQVVTISGKPWNSYV
ncbi:hypothetical protein V5799_022433 [Amblyomma americanum]|uniref:Fatty acid desaturase n=1 Tax=Amblyomma americanum TaxID=6943 RepID=A0AAQ4FMU3_AMBAM